MSNEEIVQAWKDAEYRQRLSAEEQARLPEHPAGAIELTDEELGGAAGGEMRTFETLECCLTNVSACVYCWTLPQCTEPTPLTQ